MSLPSALARPLRPTESEAALPDLHAAHLAEMAQAFTRLGDAMPLATGAEAPAGAPGPAEAVLAAGPEGLLPDPAPTAIEALPVADPQPVPAAQVAGPEQPSAGSEGANAPGGEGPPAAPPDADTRDAAAALSEAGLSGDATEPMPAGDGAADPAPPAASGAEEPGDTGAEDAPAPAGEDPPLPDVPPEEEQPPLPDLPPEEEPLPPELPPELDLPPGPGPFPFDEFAALQALLAEIEAGLRDLQRQLADLPPPPPGFDFELPVLPSLPPLPDPWAFL